MNYMDLIGNRVLNVLELVISLKEKYYISSLISLGKPGASSIFTTQQPDHLIKTHNTHPPL